MFLCPDALFQLAADALQALVDALHGGVHFGGERFHLFALPVVALNKAEMVGPELAEALLEVGAPVVGVAAIFFALGNDQVEQCLVFKEPGGRPAFSACWRALLRATRSAQGRKGRERS